MLKKKDLLTAFLEVCIRHFCGIESSEKILAGDARVGGWRGGAVVKLLGTVS